MSATPIPRTLALILYGDLDISIIDELPPNRKKIETYAVRKNMEERVNNFIRKQITEGRQAYIVCPLVEENEDMEGLQSVIELAEKYQKETFSEYKVAYLHGKMKPKEKDDIMLRFKNGEIDIHSMGASSASILFIGMVRAEAHLEALTHYKSSPSEVQIEQWVKMAVDTFLIAFKSKKQK
jgi:hypothetical protein